MKYNKKNNVSVQLKGLKIAIAILAIPLIIITIFALLNLKSIYENRSDFFYFCLADLPSLLFYIYLYMRARKKLNHIKNIFE